MKTYKKVSGERLVAAIIDYVFMQIIGVVLAIVLALFYGFDSLIDSFLNSSGTDFDGPFLWYLFISSYLSLILGVLYFSLIPKLMNGATIGKKIIGLKVIDEDGLNPSFAKHLIRAIQNWPVYYTAIITPFVLISYFTFSILSVFSFLFIIIEIVALIMILSREDGRGLHDMMVGTWVIKATQNIDEDFAMKTAQMGDWLEVEDKDDQGFKDDFSEKDEDDWNF